MTEEQLQQIRDRLKAATPGPWTVVHELLNCWIPEVDGPMAIGENDAEFIAHAPEDIAALLAEVERRRHAQGVA